MPIKGRVVDPATMDTAWEKVIVMQKYLELGLPQQSFVLNIHIFVTLSSFLLTMGCNTIPSWVRLKKNLVQPEVQQNHVTLKDAKKSNFALDAQIHRVYNTSFTLFCQVLPCTEL